MSAGLVLVVLLTPFTFVFWWAYWVGAVIRKADETPLTTPELEASRVGWRFRLPWFRLRAAALERAGYRQIGWIDERYHARFVIKQAVFWNAEHRSYAFLFSMLGRAKFTLIAIADHLLVRTGATNRSYSLVGPHFIDGGFRDWRKRIVEHHERLLVDRDASLDGSSPGDGELAQALGVLRARAVRGAPQDPPFVFGEHELGPNDHVQHIPFMNSPAELFEFYDDTFAVDFDIDHSWDSIYALLTILRTTDDERIVLVHERYPGVVTESEEYLDALRDAAWRSTNLLIVFAQRLN